MHGFAFNVTNEPLAWFDQVVACGLADVRATSLSKAVGPSKVLTMEGEMDRVPGEFGEVMDRRVEELTGDADEEIMELVKELEKVAKDAGPWSTKPSFSSS